MPAKEAGNRPRRAVAATNGQQFRWVRRVPSKARQATRGMMGFGVSLTTATGWERTQIDDRGDVREQ